MNTPGYVWIITRDIVDDGLAVGRWGPSCGNTKPDPAELPDFFRLLDGDGIVQYYGKTNALTGGSRNRVEEGFEPLDDFGAAEGCTVIEYRNTTTGKWGRITMIKWNISAEDADLIGLIADRVVT